MNLSINSSGWIAMAHGGQESLGYWDEEGVCKLAEPSRG
jgi:hypothetical protein